MALEELDLPYTVRWINLTEGEQHDPDFLRVNPNGKIPAIIDTDGPGDRPITLFESGAILHYLADKTGRLLPADPHLRWRASCWVHWQVANQGPMLGQAAHFVSHAANRGITDDYARTRYVNQAARVYQVMEDALSEQGYLAQTFSIADIAAFPWTRVAKGQGIQLDDYPAVAEWSARIAERPSAKTKVADQRSDEVRSYRYTDDQWAALFGMPPAASTGGNR